MTWNFKAWLITLLIIALIILIIVIGNLLYQTGFGWLIDFKLASKLGALVGGIFTLFSVVFIALTLENQRQSNETAKIENRFYSMLDYHRENVSQIKVVDPDSMPQEKEIGNRTFLIIFRQVGKAIIETRSILENKKTSEIYLESILKDLPKESSLSFSLKELAIIDISYCVVFFGVSYNEKEILRRFLKEYYNKDLINSIITGFEDFCTEYDEGIKYFGGHLHRLSHYYRHLYNIVTYINKQHISFSEKYDYIKTLRAQMSTYEQGLFFYNSLSRLGREWELDFRFRKAKEGKSIENKFITNYKMISNLPVELVDVSVKNYYPIEDNFK